jgi:hypothetical protein
MLLILCFLPLHVSMFLYVRLVFYECDELQFSPSKVKLNYTLLKDDFNKKSSQVNRHFGL